MNGSHTIVVEFLLCGHAILEKKKSITCSGNKNKYDILNRHSWDVKRNLYIILNAVIVVVVVIPAFTFQYVYIKILAQNDWEVTERCQIVQLSVWKTEFMFT